MRPSIEVHDALARLLCYPRHDYAAAVEQAAHVLASECPQAWEPLAAFAESVHDKPLGELEESFSATFDNSKERALEVGWHAFGENYTRGTFMVGIRGRLRENGIAENGELPDHLSHVLALLGQADAQWAGDMASGTVRPAVKKIHAALVESKSPWAGLLASVGRVLALHEPSKRRPVGSWIPTTPPLPADAPARSLASSPGASPSCTEPADESSPCGVTSPAWELDDE